MILNPYVLKTNLEDIDTLSECCSKFVVNGTDNFSEDIKSIVSTNIVLTKKSKSVSNVTKNTSLGANKLSLYTILIAGLKLKSQHLSLPFHTT
jgi:hypothetical protein